MLKQENNFAFIDGTNLHKGVSELGWQLDYNKQGETKGNCDAEMVLQTVSDMYENNYEKAVFGKIFFLDRFKERLKYRKNNEKAPL